MVIAGEPGRESRMKDIGLLLVVTVPKTPNWNP